MLTVRTVDQHAQKVTLARAFSSIVACTLAVRASRSAQLLSELEESVAAIVAAVNQKKDHIPPVVSSKTVTFPFEIAIRGCAPDQRP